MKTKSIKEILDFIDERLEDVMNRVPLIHRRYGSNNPAYDMERGRFDELNDLRNFILGIDE